ncbi:MAG: DUF3419 family protein [Hyphomicrobiaceae bacterium]
MGRALEPWVDEAADLSLAFAQVREDPLLDGWVVREIGAGSRVLMVASGGCTAAYLAAVGRCSHLHLVDPNAAQLALTRLKLHLLQHASTAERLGTLGHREMDGRADYLAKSLMALGLPGDALGKTDDVGPDHAGRYERTFAELRSRLKPVRSHLEAVMRLRDPAIQSASVDPASPLGKAIDDALDDVMSLPNLVALFGEGATRNRVEPFSRHFARRTRHAMATLPAADNLYLWQMYLGLYPEQAPAPWFALPAPSVMPRVTWSNTLMIPALQSTSERFDFVHLSNILDWLSPDEARATLESAARVLDPGGWTLVRQLNSTLDIPSSGPAFEWLAPQAKALHARDRSFFYRGLYLGRRR